ncbi:hypothetical protein B0T10DRAFT_458516 [Thelonectria olida]|uniref:Uncharacterized protein n=1 Tax=Thelonectria olida TaxID=1576542 RepID=A0A9P8W9P0_9HYPO|nr:hypothetical protein B0T10DRAFT_458516 [Thelonectria olida]
MQMTPRDSSPRHSFGQVTTGGCDGGLVFALGENPDPCNAKHQPGSSDGWTLVVDVNPRNLSKGGGVEPPMAHSPERSPHLTSPRTSPRLAPYIGWRFDSPLHSQAMQASNVLVESPGYLGTRRAAVDGRSGMEW